MDADPRDGGLLDSLVRIGRAAAGGAVRDPAPAVLSDRTGGVVVRVGDLVVKAHRPGSVPAALEARLRIAAHPLLRDVLLAPLRPPGEAAGGLFLRVGGRLVTLWPAGEPVRPEEPDAAPWEQAARLLARLHAVPVGRLPQPPSAGGPARVAGALARLRDAAGAPARAGILRAAASLPAAARGGPAPAGAPQRPPPGVRAALVHGDWHLGQLVRRPGGDGRRRDRWRLIDVDDLGTGDPAWDLARPAALFAAGLLAPADWGRLLAAYRAAGGRALPPDGDPWPVLDLPARALTVQLAAQGALAAGREGRAPDDEEAALVAACRRFVDTNSPGTYREGRSPRGGRRSTAGRRRRSRRSTRSAPRPARPYATTDRGTPMMQCPKCHGSMRDYNRNGVQIEQCENCRGIFLDYGELEHISQMEAQWNQQAPQPPPGQPGWGAPSHHGHQKRRGFGRMLFSS